MASPEQMDNPVLRPLLLALAVATRPLLHPFVDNVPPDLLVCPVTRANVDNAERKERRVHPVRQDEMDNKGRKDPRANKVCKANTVKPDRKVHPARRRLAMPKEHPDRRARPAHPE